MLGPPSGGGLRGELTDAARGGATERGGAGAAGAARVGTSWAGGACIWRFYIRDLENKTKTLTKQSISRDAISARRTKQEMKNDVRNEMYASSNVRFGRITVRNCKWKVCIYCKVSVNSGRAACNRNAVQAPSPLQCAEWGVVYWSVHVARAFFPSLLCIGESHYRILHVGSWPLMTSWPAVARGRQWLCGRSRCHAPVQSQRLAINSYLQDVFACGFPGGFAGGIVSGFAVGFVQQSGL